MGTAREFVAASGSWLVCVRIQLVFSERLENLPGVKLQGIEVEILFRHFVNAGEVGD
jgi:hypothetical protein